VLDQDGRGTVTTVAMFTVILEGEVVGAANLPEFVDGVMDALLDLGAEDPFVFADASVPSVRAEVSVQAQSQSDALTTGVQTINDALQSVEVEPRPTLRSPSARAENLIAA
jgi:hypothetical protein